MGTTDTETHETPEMPETHEHLNTSKRYSGKVKWFNNKAGYGFITLNSSDPLDAELNNSDVFVHHSVINVKTKQYKYLVQGEYVELSLIPAKNQYKYKYQANDVSGVCGGSVLCESMRTTNEPAQTVNKKAPPVNVNGPPFTKVKREQRHR
jgi:cold shock CspA family protein